ncbi:glyoxalase/bleomycin resistance/dioxygenase family protein [Streptomyces sp. 3MP-14]|uniref:Glyoxalase/bleomycin resistance/dioxygenase family protein n=1 Tax=Streptomyces mimosae TaxID=2586635 RepID=A0A5N6A785_9ACTN|nr:MULTISPECIES: VOC family protein [Streptomyces]KAB8164644.1 glyoxalase/bleomycin resistance/dioxygenase family protein [Streptomyces mimosae]KAB8175560.1 glyoxalase/bleomycin resistance/dioxygenase family protein [Streptomyces sp. 3MP-14]
MHRSRLHVVLIDTPPETSDAELAFWGAALGRQPVPEEGTPFATLTRLAGGELLAHQRLGEGEPRIHLDLESDDVAAEVARVEALGATRIGEHDGCVHLRDPAGLVFCVVPVQSEDFAERATTWP